MQVGKHVGPHHASTCECFSVATVDERDMPDLADFRRFPKV